MKRFATLVLAAAILTILAAGPATAGQRTHDGLWQVTIQNLTPPGPGGPGSRPLSPPLFVVHAGRADVWSVGTIASHGVAAIAEDANNAPLASALPQLPGVRAVFTGAGGPIPSGQSRTFLVGTTGPFDWLTVLTMLVNTNEAFTGLDALRLGGQGTAVATMAYDAGSERNNELAAFIPGPAATTPSCATPRAS